MVCQDVPEWVDVKTDFKTACRSRKLEEFFSVLGDSHISRMVNRRFRLCPKFLVLYASIYGMSNRIKGSLHLEGGTIQQPSGVV